MKKFTKISMMTAVVLLTGMVSLSALAAPGNGPRGMMGTYNHHERGNRNPMMSNDSTDLDAFMAQRTEQMKANLDAKVAAGTLTQVQADELFDLMTQQQENFGYSPRRMMGTYNHHNRANRGPMMSNHSTDLNAFMAQRTEQMKATLDAKVADGTLTQAQADDLFDLMTKQMESNSLMGNKNRMMGPRGGFGGCMWGN